MSNKVYDKITNYIIEKIQYNIDNEIPFHWVSSFSQDCAAPHNWISKQPYSGLNCILTSLAGGGAFITYCQIQSLNKKIMAENKRKRLNHSTDLQTPLITLRAGCHGVPILAYGEYKKKDEEDEENKSKRKNMFVKYHTVFSINDCLNFPKDDKNDIQLEVFNPIEDAENLVNNYCLNNSIDTTCVPGSAFFNPTSNIINMPPKNHFITEEDYYHTFFHEMVHSTKKAVNRPTSANRSEYAYEELVAEIGADFLAASIGIIDKVQAMSVEYLGSWLKVLKNDSSCIIRASQLAQKASEYVLDSAKCNSNNLEKIA